MTTNRIEFRAMALDTFVQHQDAPPADQFDQFREGFLESFLSNAAEEIPNLVYGRRTITPEEGDPVDYLLFAVVADKDEIPFILQAALRDEFQWVCQVSEAFATRREGERQECLVFAFYAPPMKAIAIHGFDRHPGDLPMPVGTWDIQSSAGGADIGGKLVPETGD